MQTLRTQDDETLRCLKSEDIPTGLKGWLLMLYNRLYVHDIDAVIGHNETVMRIHGNCENFYVPAEFCFAKIQVCLFACRAASSKIRHCHIYTQCCIHHSILRCLWQLIPWKLRL